MCSFCDKITYMPFSQQLRPGHPRGIISGWARSLAQPTEVAVWCYNSTWTIQSLVFRFDQHKMEYGRRR
jgi:hypothetical protein